MALGWRARLAQEDDAPELRRTGMRAVNPSFIPRKQRIETAIRDAEEGRYDAFHELNNVLARPYEDQPQSARYTQPPAPLKRCCRLLWDDTKISSAMVRSRRYEPPAFVMCSELAPHGRQERLKTYPDG